MSTPPGDDAQPIRARWFDGRSSRGREVLVALEPGKRGPSLHVHVPGQDRTASRQFDPREVDWPPQWSADRSPASVTVGLSGHGSLQIDEPQAWQAALTAVGAPTGLAHRMQTRWRVLLGVLAIVTVGLFIFFRYGTPWLAVQLTRHVPLAWELQLSEQALTQVDGRWFKPSQLGAERQAELRRAFDDLARQLPPDLKRYRDYAPRYELHFRRGMGPNAFALPGGTVVMTDELVERAAQLGLDDHALLGVLAHEIGHVVHRHGTRLVVEQAVLNVGLGLALGDLTSVVSMAGTLLTGLSYRRQHEAEADCFALAVMGRVERPTAPMADLLTGLSGGSKGEATNSPIPDWLRTHPATPQRAQMLKSGQAASCAR